jgi:hypothetical protein
MPSFASRLQDHVKGKIHNGIKVDADLVWLSHPLNHNAYIYNNMWAYGNHYWIEPEIGPTNLTYDLGVACIFKQASRSSVRNQNMVVAYLQFVGILKEILVVTYPSLHVCYFVAFGFPQTFRLVLVPYAKMNMAFGWWILQINSPPWKSHMYFLH